MTDLIRCGYSSEKQKLIRRTVGRNASRHFFYIGRFGRFPKGKIGTHG